MTLALDPERQLALAHVPAAKRKAVEALWRLDVTFGAVLAIASEPMISRIRLAWWRESLEKLDEAPAPPEPLLQAVARHLLPAGVEGAELAAMEEGWALLAGPEPPGRCDLDEYARRRGGRLFEYSARLLGGAPAASGGAGECWALVDLARRSAGEAEARAATEAARERRVPARWPRPLRPLGMLAVLARRDAARGPPFERQGSPARALRMLRHRLTGI